MAKRESWLMRRKRENAIEHMKKWCADGGMPYVVTVHLIPDHETQKAMYEWSRTRDFGHHSFYDKQGVLFWAFQHAGDAAIFESRWA